jgi:hypothetical protein
LRTFLPDVAENYENDFLRKCQIARMIERKKEDES